MIDFLVVDAPSAYNAILGRGTLNAIGAIYIPSDDEISPNGSRSGSRVRSPENGEGMLFDVSEGEEGALAGPAAGKKTTFKVSRLCVRTALFTAPMVVMAHLTSDFLLLISCFVGLVFGRDSVN